MNEGTYPGGRTVDATNEIKRVSVPALDNILGHAFPLLDHGFIRVIDYMGDEAAVVQAARVSYGTGTKEVSEDRGLLRYLMRHRHSTPFEMCELKLHVKLPIFVARQWIRHRTANVNEYSARYSILAREFYVPEPVDIAKQSKANKQGRGAAVDPVAADGVRSMVEDSSNQAFDLYELLVRDDEPDDLAVARELARIVTPMSTYTEWYWKVDLHNLLHFLSLRADPHAQKEIRVYAELMLDLVKSWAPNIAEAFEDYRLDAVTFSKQEMGALRRLVTWFPEGPIEGLSKREVDAFRLALGMEVAP